MPEHNDASRGEKEPDLEAIRGIGDACVNEQIQDAIKKYDESQGKKKKWKNSWRSASPITKGTFVLTAAIAVATIAYAFIALLTLDAMRTISSESGTQTQQLIDAANQMKEAAWRFKGSAQGIDGNLGIAVSKLQGQVDQIKRSADAAEKAAGIADQTLHISERAYVVAEDPQLNFSLKSIDIPLVNSGHLPSGTATSVVHEATYYTPTSEVVPFDAPAEKSWEHTNWISVLPGSHESIGIPVPLLDEKLTNSGGQTTIVAGTISYNDGFPRTPTREWKFCFRTIYHSTMKKSFIILCNPEKMIPKLEKVDGYPNNENPGHEEF